MIIMKKIRKYFKKYPKWHGMILIFGILFSLYVIYFLYANVVQSYIMSKERDSLRNAVLLTDLKYGNEFSEDSGAIYFDSRNMHGVRVYSTLDCQSTEDFLYAKVFDENKNEIFSGFLDEGYNKINLIGYHLDDIYSSYILTICWSNEYGDWTRDTPGIFCRTERFDPPVFNIEINPDPLVFSLEPKKENLWVDCDEWNIVVTNKGDFTISVAPVLQDESYVKNNGKPYLQIPLLEGGQVQSKILRPNELTEFTISVCAEENDKNLQTTGYIVIGGQYYRSRENVAYEIPFIVNVEVS